MALCECLCVHARVYELWLCLFPVMKLNIVKFAKMWKQCFLMSFKIFIKNSCMRPIPPTGVLQAVLSSVMTPPTICEQNTYHQAHCLCVGRLIYMSVSIIAFIITSCTIQPISVLTSWPPKCVLINCNFKI